MARAKSNGIAPEYAEIGDRLRMARTDQGLSLRGLAEQLGVSPSLISQVERGRAKPSVNTLYAMARVLDISLDELLFIDARAGAGAGTTIPLGALRPNERNPYAPTAPVQTAAGRKSIRLASGVMGTMTSHYCTPVRFAWAITGLDGHLYGGPHTLDLVRPGAEPERLVDVRQAPSESYERQLRVYADAVRTGVAPGSRGGRVPRKRSSSTTRSGVRWRILRPFSRMTEQNPQLNLQPREVCRPCTGLRSPDAAA